MIPAPFQTCRMSLASLYHPLGLIHRIASLQQLIILYLSGAPKRIRRQKRRPELCPTDSFREPYDFITSGIAILLKNKIKNSSWYNCIGKNQHVEQAWFISFLSSIYFEGQVSVSHLVSGSPSAHTSSKVVSPVCCVYACMHKGFQFQSVLIPIRFQAGEERLMIQEEERELDALENLSGTV